VTVSVAAATLHNVRRERGDGYAAALRHVGNRLLSGLHHCVRTGQLYEEHVMLPGWGPVDGRPEQGLT
jgi:hypothetical protein